MKKIIPAIVTTLIVLLMFTFIVTFLHDYTHIEMPGFINDFATAISGFFQSLKEFFNAHNPFVHIN